MIIQIARLHDFNVGMRGGNLVGEAIDPVNQDSRKQKIGKDDDAFEAKPRHMFKTGLNKREGNARITDFCPTKSHPFPEHA